MKLGAQLYSVRNHTQTPEGLAKTFAELKAIGYETVQISAICPMEAEELKKLGETYGLGIPSTHTDCNRIISDTEAVIAEHKTFNCHEIGIGSMPTEYRGSIEGVRKFIKDFTPAMKKIRDAGLLLSYHNHAFEFDALDGTDAYETTDGETILRLNRCRCAAREAELKAVAAFTDREGNPTRIDLLQAMNRLSSMIYILMIKLKSQSGRD